MPALSTCVISGTLLAHNRRLRVTRAPGFAAVSRRLNGRAAIDIDDLENIAELLKVAPVSLLAESA